MDVLSDAEIARQLDMELNANQQSPREDLAISGYVPANNVRSSDLNATQNIVNSEWELLDPTPNVHALFRAFDGRFFKAKLQCVELEWSKKMYQCAGICYQRSRGMWKTCVIRLSEPLLKLRSRKDLVETLLHEMIHAYCFVQGIREGNGGHGPTFISIMRNINQKAGTNITVYHTFHDEVELYRTHVWRCNGICQHRAPFYGYVKRTMNRAPGPSDYWFRAHHQSCGGVFEKKSQPDKSTPKRTSAKKVTATAAPDIRTFFVPSSQEKPQVGGKKRSADADTHSPSKKAKPADPLPSTSSQQQEVWKKIDDDVFIEDPQIPLISLDDTLEPSKKICPKERQSQIMEEIMASIRDNAGNDPEDVIELIDDDYNDDDTSTKDILLDQSVLDDLFGKDTLMEDFTRKTDASEDYVKCPVCDLCLPRSVLSEHMEGCLGIIEHIKFNLKAWQQHETPKKSSKSSKKKAEKSITVPKTEAATPTSPAIVLSPTVSPVVLTPSVSCPVCSELIAETEINEHLDLCLVLQNLQEFD